MKESTGYHPFIDNGNMNPLQLFEKTQIPLPASSIKFIFELYNLLQHAPDEIGDWARQRTFEAAADGICPWQVVAISESAIRHVVLTKSSRGLARGHAISRKERHLGLFSAKDKILSPEELVKLFFEQDLCAVITTAENREKGFNHWSPLYSVVAPNFLAGAGSFSVPVRKRTEVKWCEELIKRIEAGMETPKWSSSRSLPTPSGG